MDRVNNLLTVHGHQPIGNLPHIFDVAYQQAYLPFMRHMAQQPRQKFALHFSGVLYDWFSVQHPDFLDQIRALVKRGQAEVLTAGYYEPILSLIPDEDKIGQIERMNHFVREKFGSSPRGIWLAPHDWEMGFPAIFSDLGIEYALVNCDKPPDGFYLTEHHGKILKICPLSPVKLEDPLSKIPSEYLQMASFEESTPQGRIYLPGEVYYRNFLIEHPEANNLHKKMLYISSKLQALKKGKTLFGDKARDAQLESAGSELYRGQCGDAYWNNAFGGLQLPYLRAAVYQHLLRSENEIEKISRGGKNFVELVVTDFDKDGNDEVILSNNLLNLYFSPTCGGAMFEMDYKPAGINLLNTFVRRGAQPGYSLLDRFLSPAPVNLAQQPYTFMPHRRPDEVGVKMVYSGRVKETSIRLEKRVDIHAKLSIVHIEYVITNQGKTSQDFHFGVDFNFSLPAGGQGLPAVNFNAENEIKLVDERNGFAVLFQVDRPAFLEKGNSICPSWKFTLAGAEEWKLKIVLRIEA
ncbi:MAG: alpha-amylase/4-alpha-glucanotransferase domain-containing protein [Candidatus Margulisiibacteriota bacterium]